MPISSDYQIWQLPALLEQVEEGAFRCLFQEYLSGEEQAELLAGILVGIPVGLVEISTSGDISNKGAEIQFLADCFLSKDSYQAYYVLPEEIVLTANEPKPAWIPFRVLHSLDSLLKFQLALEDTYKAGIISASNVLAARYQKYALPVVTISNGEEE